MSFRPAERRDCEVLWRWRLQDERQPWYVGQGTTYGTHERWFGRNRHRIKMWEAEGVPLGCVRVESDGSLAFSVAPMARQMHQDSIVEMLKATLAVAANHGGRLKATVDEADVWRQGVLVRAGFSEFPSKSFIGRRDTW